LAQTHSQRAGKPSPFSTKVCDMAEALLTADEVAGLLGVTKSWVYEQSRRGRIPTISLGRYRRYRRQSIDAWLENLESSRTATQARRRDAA